MNNKIVFDIGAVEVLQSEENIPQFQRLKLQIVCSGDNLHHLPISPSAIEKAIPSLVGKPILCHYKTQRGGEFGGHDVEQVPVGVILSKEDIFYQEINGKQWLCCYAFLWSRYFENVINVFRKNDGKSKLSMEIDVLEINPKNNEILSFIFAGISLIGVPEAIPGANAELIQFSQIIREFEHDKQILFSSQNQLTHFPKHGHNKPIALINSLFSEFDFDYATSLQSEYPSVWGRGGNLRGKETFALWGKARAEDKSQIVLDWIKERESWAKRHVRDRSIGGVMAQVKWGIVSDYGLDKMKETIENEKKNHDAKNRAYFEGGEKIMPYFKLSEINDSLKGIDPPITLGQANAIAKQADSIGVDKDKNGWAIAISGFKKSHVVKDGKWVEKDKKEFEQKEVEEMTDEVKDKLEEIKELEMATPPEEKPAEKPEEKPEGKPEEKPEEKLTPKKAQMSEFCDMDKMSEFVAESEFSAEFAAEAVKEDGVDFSVVVKACYSAFCKMAEKFDASEKDKDAYMAKMQEYEARFAELEKQKFSIAVESLLKDKDISESLSKDEVEECRADAVNFSLETISGWENKVKALAFTHSKGKKVETTIKYALPFHDEPEKSNLLFK